MGRAAGFVIIPVFSFTIKFYNRPDDRPASKRDPFPTKRVRESLFIDATKGEWSGGERARRNPLIVRY